MADQPCPEGHFCLEGTATTATTCGHPRSERRRVYSSDTSSVAVRGRSRQNDKPGIISGRPSCDVQWVSLRELSSLPLLRSNRFNSIVGRSPSSKLFPTLSHAERTSTLRAGYKPLGSELVLGSRAVACWDNATEDFGLQMSDLPARYFCIFSVTPWLSKSVTSGRAFCL